MGTFVALLRGINTGKAGRGRKGVPMAELRGLAEGLGYGDVSTYIQSGNLIFRGAGSAAAHAAALEEAIEGTFGFEVPVVVKGAALIRGLEEQCPFLEAAASRPQHVLFGFARGKTPTAAMAEAAAAAGRDGEQVTAGGGQVIWADYPGGIGRSRLTPAALDRAFGAPVTLRNVKTLRALAERLDGLR